MSKLNLTVGLTRVWEGPWELALSQKMSQTWEQPELTDTFHIFLPQLDILFSMRKLHKRRILNQFLLRQKYVVCYTIVKKIILFHKMFSTKQENNDNLEDTQLWHISQPSSSPFPHFASKQIRLLKHIARAKRKKYLFTWFKPPFSQIQLMLIVYLPII